MAAVLPGTDCIQPLGQQPRGLARRQALGQRALLLSGLPTGRIPGEEVPHSHGRVLPVIGHLARRVLGFSLVLCAEGEGFGVAQDVDPARLSEIKGIFHAHAAFPADAFRLVGHAARDAVVRQNRPGKPAGVVLRFPAIDGEFHQRPHVVHLIVGGRVFPFGRLGQQPAEGGQGLVLAAIAQRAGVQHLHRHLRAVHRDRGQPLPGEERRHGEGHLHRARGLGLHLISGLRPALGAEVLRVLGGKVQRQILVQHRHACTRQRGKGAGGAAGLVDGAGVGKGRRRQTQGQRGGAQKAKQLLFHGSSPLSSLRTAFWVKWFRVRPSEPHALFPPACAPGPCIRPRIGPRRRLSAFWRTRSAWRRW